MTHPTATAVGVQQVLLVRHIPAPAKKTTWMGRVLECFGVSKPDSDPSAGRTVHVARLIPRAAVMERPPRRSLFTLSPEAAQRAYASARERVEQRLDVERARIAAQRPQKPDHSKLKSVPDAFNSNAEDPSDEPAPSAPPA